MILTERWISVERLADALGPDGKLHALPELAAW
jgi:hypothetical protein